VLFSREWCKERMANYWMPSQLKVLEEMPRNALGKVNKKELLKSAFPPK
jgi:malonyl-CoA/methylmalonyl-CoA synthetase